MCSKQRSIIMLSMKRSPIVFHAGCLQRYIIKQCPLRDNDTTCIIVTRSLITQPTFMRLGESNISELLALKICLGERAKFQCSMIYIQSTTKKNVVDRSIDPSIDTFAQVRFRITIGKFVYLIQNRVKDTVNYTRPSL